MSKQESISIVIPACNEEGNISPLIKELSEALRNINRSVSEIIFIDDGSVDNTVEEICSAVKMLSATKVILIKMRRRFGKSNALAAGFARATGSIVATLDADGQDNPVEIVKLLKKLDEGYDVVSGWKTLRNDPLTKKIPSVIFNYILRKLTRLKLHDVNCGLKVYRRNALSAVKLYGDMHRYIPVILSDLGFRIGEVSVEHRCRVRGISKYGATRMITGALDFLTVFTISRFAYRPGHFFGGIGILLGALGVTILFYLTCLWFFGMGPIGTRPLFFLGIISVLLGANLVLFGVLAEMIVRLFYGRLPEEIIEHEETILIGNYSPPMA